LIKAAQNVIYVVQQIGPYPAPVVAFKKALETPVFEASNHRGAS